ncbi:hypothetical protein ACFU96_08380 [Streptomyces sp. NPDC057620]
MRGENLQINSARAVPVMLLAHAGMAPNTYLNLAFSSARSLRGMVPS